MRVKNVIGSVMIVMSIFVYNGCAPGLQDWTYYLPNDCTIDHCSMSVIVLNKKGYLRLVDKKKNSFVSGTIIDGYISEFCYNDIWIGVKTITFPGSNDKLAEARKKADYYLVNGKTGESYGPFGEEDFLINCMDFSVGDLCPWMVTYPPPDDVVFP